MLITNQIDHILSSIILLDCLNFMGKILKAVNLWSCVIRIMIGTKKIYMSPKCVSRMPPGIVEDWMLR